MQNGCFLFALFCAASPVLSWKDYCVNIFICVDCIHKWHEVKGNVRAREYYQICLSLHSSEPRVRPSANTTIPRRKRVINIWENYNCDKFQRAAHCLMLLLRSSIALFFYLMTTGGGSESDVTSPSSLSPQQQPQKLTNPSHLSFKIGAFRWCQHWHEWCGRR